MKPAMVVLLALLGALFLWLGWTGGAGNAFDVLAIERLAAIRHADPGLTAAVILLTQLGSALVTVSISALMAAYLWGRQRRAAATALIATVLGERLVADTIKLAYHRIRPSFDLHPVTVSSWSFPSGHAANGMTTFVALALFAAPPRYRVAALAGAILLGVAVGLSRVFLGVHWPSDVLGGWALAAIALIVAWRLATPQQQHQIVGRHRPPLDQG